MTQAPWIGWLRWVLAVVIGLFVGAMLNGLLIKVGYSVVPLPAGTDVSTPSGFQAAASQFTAANYTFPFLAHALGTLAGAFVAVKIASIHRTAAAGAIGIAFLIGGILMVRMLPGTPLWFIVLDLVVAYLPMAWLGYRLGK